MQQIRTDDLEQTVISCARRVTRCSAEFPDDPSIWAEDLDGLYDAVTALDRHLNANYELAERLDNAEWKLRQLGYSRCDMIACNCKGYHHDGSQK